MIVWRNFEKLNLSVVSSVSEINAAGEQPISLKLLKGLGCFPARKSEISHVGTTAHCLLSMFHLKISFAKTSIPLKKGNRQESDMRISCLILV